MSKKKMNIVVPYESTAMLRMYIPLLELGRLYDLNISNVSEEADVNIYMPWRAWLIQEKKYGKSILAYTHMNPGDTSILREISDQVDGFVCMSFAGRNELVNYVGIDPKKVWVNYCAADEFKYAKKVIGVCGYRQPNGRKNENLLIDLAWSYDLSSYEFVFTGVGWEETVETLKNLGVSAGIIPQIKDENMERFYKVIDLLLVTGYAEGGPLPLLEAMAAGKKVLSPYYGYANDLLPKEWIYSNVDELHQRLDETFGLMIENHQLARAWSWVDYAAEYALFVGRIMGTDTDLYPHRMQGRYHQLLEEISLCKPKTICEIGTWNGSTAIRMIQEAAKYRPIEEIDYIGYDLFELQLAKDVTFEKSKWSWPSRLVKRRIDATTANVKLVKGNTLNTLVDQDISEVDFFFVDGGHSKATIRSDGEKVLNALRNNSVAVFDDYYYESTDQEYGCNDFIDSLDRTKYTVEYLPEITVAEDGRKIGMVKVTKVISFEEMRDMPNYEYECENNHVTTRYVSYDSHDEIPKSVYCIECGKVAKRTFSKVNVNWGGLKPSEANSRTPEMEYFINSADDRRERYLDKDKE